MATNAGNVRVALTGGVYYDPTGSATRPTGANSDIESWSDGGFVSEDGVALQMPDAGEATPIKAWQNGAIVRIIRSAPDTFPELTLRFIETKLEVIELVFGVTVTRSATDGEFTIDVSRLREHVPLVVDAVDGDERIRIFAPKAIVTSIGEIPLKHDETIAYEVTISLEHDTDLGGQALVWMTALRTGNDTPSA